MIETHPNGRILVGMNEFFLMVAEAGPLNEGLFESMGLSTGMVWAGAVFLILLSVGLAMELGLVAYFIKHPPQPSVWGRGLARRALPGRFVFLSLLVMMVLYVGHSLVYGVVFPGAVELEPRMLMFQALFFHIPALIILFGMIYFWRRSGVKRLGLSFRNSLKMLGLSALLYLAILPVVWFFSMVSQLLFFMMGVDSDLQDVVQLFRVSLPVVQRVAVLFAAIVLAPVFEEIVFRGVLLPWVVKRTGFWSGIILVSLLFAGIHLHLPSLLPLFTLSLMFCMAYAYTQSLWVPIGMHALFNGVTIAIVTLIG